MEDTIMLTLKIEEENVRSKEYKKLPKAGKGKKKSLPLSL